MEERKRTLSPSRSGTVAITPPSPTKADDTHDPDASIDSRELLTASLAHALVGAAEAHASRAEGAANHAGAGPADIGQAALMAFAGVNCQNEADELSLIAWRATRLCQVLTMLDFGGPAPHFPRQGEVGSGDALIRAMRMVAAALSGMATPAHTAVDPMRGDGEAADAGQALIKAAAVLQEAAKEVHTLRAMGELMAMTD
ncbi:hypothetical protein ACFXJ8_07340 [Nonomuraea sp. NPDC059194]|uniref:hypothetical protein n=1 Tax=Nonomuraea sp. NPDC059194 TaxID=3346764 RepID=UPI0036B026FF